MRSPEQAVYLMYNIIVHTLSLWRKEYPKLLGEEIKPYQWRIEDLMPHGFFRIHTHVLDVNLHSVLCHAIYAFCT